jgi:hypothetical protein
MFAAVADAAFLVETQKAKKEEEVEPIFNCPICVAKFGRRFNRDRHVELIHKIPRPDLPPLYPEKLNLKEHTVDVPKTPEDNVSPILPKPTKKIFKIQSEVTPVLPKKKLTEGKRSFSHTKKSSEAAPVLPKKKLAEGKRPSSDDDDYDELPAKKVHCPQDLPVTQVPIQHEIPLSRTMMPMISLHYCGTCDYPKKHRFVQLSNGHAVVIVPLCEECKELNLAITTVVKDVKTRCQK